MRDQILDAATRLFARRGFNGTSLDEIAEHLDVSKGAFYYHIKNKEDLLYHCYSRSLDSDGFESRKFSKNFKVKGWRLTRDLYMGGVKVNGEYGPGGGFQAGALIAAAFILYALIEGEERTLQVLPQGALNALMVGGALLYGGVGLVGMLGGAEFLNYSVLAANPVKGQQLGILLIEAGVGITVTGVLLSIFHAFAARDR